jgi:beta-phosphoglucomutase-like phosphatase (HAD superfamily)
MEHPDETAGISRFQAVMFDRDGVLVDSASSTFIEAFDRRQADAEVER